jgi:hypothetical protein
LVGGADRRIILWQRLLLPRRLVTVLHGGLACEIPCAPRDLPEVVDSRSMQQLFIIEISRMA